MNRRHLMALAGLALAGGLMLSSTAPQAAPPSGHPLLLIGMDGGEWSVIEDLWAQGKMPNFKRLADGGVRAPLKTKYGQSPVIWTTIATGHNPDVHGITGFVVATDDGDVPVSSDMRTVPAIWNITSSAGLKTHVVGWWGAWPAEPVNGVNISERCQQKDLADCATPAEWDKKVRAALPNANSTHNKLFPGEDHFAPEDRVTTEFAPKLAKSGFDSMIVYLHGSDPNSHKYWRYYRPSDFPDNPPNPEEMEKHGKRVTKAYESIDTVVGRIVDAAPEGTNVLIVSDHGFRPLDEIKVKVSWDLDELLVHWGYATKSGTGIDTDASKVYTYGTKKNEVRKRVKINATGDEKTRIQNELFAKLDTVTYANGEKAFEYGVATGRDKERGGDITVSTIGVNPTKQLVVDGKNMGGVITGWVENSGGHNGNPEGIFIAHGPDIAKGAKLGGIGIHDVTPTALYGLGLPVPMDTAGRAFIELYSPAFQSANPMKTIDTYGTRDASNATATTEDDAVLDQLKMLGYIE